MAFYSHKAVKATNAMELPQSPFIPWFSNTNHWPPLLIKLLLFNSPFNQDLNQTIPLCE
jgi:hypothetical protein